jgi:sulfate permease, SulP family
LIYRGDIMFSALRRHVPYVAEMRAYNAPAFRSDVVAALTVAIVVLPQSMAYALIAGVDPVYGLYAAIVTAIVGSFFGSSNHLITGPTNAIALMTAGAMKDYTGSADFYPMLFLLTFMVGALQFLLGVLKVGKIVNFVSHAVIVGFTAGAGIIIGLGQMNELLGVVLPKGYHPLYEKVLITLGAIGSTNIYALGFAALTIGIVLTAKKIDRRIPGALLSLIICAWLAWLIDAGEKGVKLVGIIPDHLPEIRMVHFNLHWALDLFGAAVAIAVVGLVEAIAIAKSIALSSEQRIQPNQEFLGQGLANMTGAFFSAFPCSGSFTRSAINFSAGGATKTAGILSGILVALTLVSLVAYAKFIPMASLAGVIVIVAYGMVDQHAIGRIARASRHDMSVMLITAGATVVMPDLERAILTGIAVSILVHIWNTGEIRVRLLKPHGAAFREYDLGLEKQEDSPIAIIHLDGNLYFGSASDLQEKLWEVAEQTSARAFILRLKRVNAVDISAFEVLESFVEKALEKGGHVLLCGVNPTMARFMGKSGLAERIGEANIFLAEETIYASTNKAYARAQELLAAAHKK